MKHTITITSQKGRIQNVALLYHLRRCIKCALDMEKVTVPCEINVFLTNDEGIHAINKQLRKVDAPTDVLSFPMFQFEPGNLPQDLESLCDPETGLLPLGDMTISVERAANQAKEYCHSTKREVGYLTIHSILHLLGYDHLDEGPMKRQMRAREEAILAELLL